MTNKSNVVIGALAVIALIVSVVGSFRPINVTLSVPTSLGAAGAGQTHYQDENFLQGAHFGTAGQTYISNAGVLNLATSTFSGEITLSNCGTASFTVPALSPSFSQVGANVATTSVTVSGSALGDMALVSHDSSTQALATYGITVSASINSANTAVVLFANTNKATSTAITTSTVKVCYFD